MNRALLTLVVCCFACSKKEAPPTTPTATTSTPVAIASAPSVKPAITDASGPLGDPRWALLSIIGKVPPPDGTYLADAIVVGTKVCHCPAGSKCDCPPDALQVTHDGADSASWFIRVYALYDLETRFKVGSRYRLTIRVDHTQGEPMIIDATP